MYAHSVPSSLTRRISFSSVYLVHLNVLYFLIVLGVELEIERSGKNYSYINARIDIFDAYIF